MTYKSLKAGWIAKDEARKIYPWIRGMVLHYAGDAKKCPPALRAQIDNLALLLLHAQKIESFLEKLPEPASLSDALAQVELIEKAAAARERFQTALERFEATHQQAEVHDGRAGVLDRREDHVQSDTIAATPTAREDTRPTEIAIRSSPTEKPKLTSMQRVLAARAEQREREKFIMRGSHKSSCG